MSTSSNIRVRVNREPFTWDTKEGPEERYIIIGNGFDLECGMPTSYVDYMKLIEVFWDYYKALAAHRATDRETGDVIDEIANPHAAYARILARRSRYNGLCDLNPVIRNLVNPTRRLLTTSTQNADEYYPEHNVTPSFSFLFEMVTKKPEWTNRLDSWRPLFDNFWFRFFREQQNKKKWIDFESEIARVIATVERCLWERSQDFSSLDDYIFWSGIGQIESVLKEIEASSSIFSEQNTIIKRAKEIVGLRHSREVRPRTAIIKRANETVSLYSYRDLRDRLLNDLDVLTKGLRRYLRDYACKADPVVTPAIDQIVQAVSGCEKRHVISFNYTNTLETILEQNHLGAEFCYVHGRVNEENERMQLVLGIDEYLSEDEASKRVEFAGFRKYNQRILRRTSSTYRDWLDHIESTPHVRRELIVFGHSIGVTDKDVLRPFILAPNMRTVVYYHDDTAFSEKLANMTPIIGMDAVIDRTGGKNRTLIFEEQGK